jgi:FtsP/CotA-like multicopper oxidase with cupredoxin domain
LTVLCLTTGAATTVVRARSASAAPTLVKCPANKFDKSFNESMPSTQAAYTYDATNQNAVLRSTNTKHKFQAGQPTATDVLGYVASPDGSKATPSDLYGGPTILATKDKSVMMTEKNDVAVAPLLKYIDYTIPGSAGHWLGPYGVIHLHGAANTPAFDGEPLNRLAYGGTRSDFFFNQQEATGLWYHDHYLGNTRLSVGAGLAGQYWLRDGNDTGKAGNAPKLPVGDYELPLTIQDRSFNDDWSLCVQRTTDGSLTSDGTPTPVWEPETYGDTPVVNGIAYGKLDVKKATYRFRVLNASNSRFYRLNFANAPGFSGALPTIKLVGSDGGLYNAPAALPSTGLLLAPGQRADVVADFSAVSPGNQVMLRNDTPVQPYLDFDVPAAKVPALADIMKFNVLNQTGTTITPGPNLRPAERTITPLTPIPATAKRTVVLTQKVVNGKPTMFMMNDKSYTLNQNNCAWDDKGCQYVANLLNLQAPKRNTVEEWTISNATGVAHPIHLHMTQFQIKPRTTSPPGDSVAEQGWHDTVTVPPGVTTILVPFGGRRAGIQAPFDGDPPDATNPLLTGMYVFHCHILEHEDMDMMGSMLVQQ